MAVSENNDPQSSAARRSVIFTDIKPEQAGVYNCEAENWAGVDYLTVDLVVLSEFSFEFFLKFVF